MGLTQLSKCVIEGQRVKQEIIFMHKEESRGKPNSHNHSRLFAPRLTLKFQALTFLLPLGCCCYKSAVKLIKNLALLIRAWSGRRATRVPE